MSASQIFDMEKFQELILFLAGESCNDVRFGMTKLNKLMFYTDFGCYLVLGMSATGATYQHWQAGPVAREMDEAKNLLFESEEASLVNRPYFNGVQDRIVPSRSANLAFFTSEELQIAKDVVSYFWGYNASQISEFSHKEICWQITEEKEDIPYETFLISSDPLPHSVIQLGQDTEAGGWDNAIWCAIE